MKKLISLILAFAMILSLGVPAMAAEVTGGTSGDVSASYTPVISISDIALSGDSVTVDTENKTYTVTIPADADSTIVTVTVSGQNLDKVNESVHKVSFSESFVAPLSPEEYDEATGCLTWTVNVLASDISDTLRYSTDGGNTWTETGWNAVIQQAEPEPTEVSFNAMLAAVDADGTAVTGYLQTMFEEFQLDNGSLSSLTMNTGTYELAFDVTDVNTQIPEGYKTPDAITLTITDDGNGNGIITSSDATVELVDDVYVITVTLEAESSEPDTTAKITDMSITVDSVKYDSSTAEAPVTIYSDSTVTVTVYGENFANLPEYGNQVSAFTYFGSNDAYLWKDSPEWSIVDTVNNTATLTAHNSILAEATTASELLYTNDRGATNTGSGIYVIYDEGTKPVTYTVSVSQSENGTVIADKSAAAEGETVTLTVTPDEGCKLTSLTATYVDADGETQNLPVTDNTFVMPAGNVTVTATFKAPEAEITGMSITIDGTEYDRTNTSAENPAVMTPDTKSVTIKVTGTNLQNNTNGALASYMPKPNADSISTELDWTISQDGTYATKDISKILETLRSTNVWELQYANDGDTLESSGVYVKYQAPSYEVNIGADITGGTVIAAPSPAEKGDTVTVTVEAAAGYAYVVYSLKVINDTTGLEVEVDEATKTFVMPASSVTVTAEFEKLTVTSASISWGSLSFTYTDGENGTEGAWSCKDGANKITVTNTGDNAVNVQPLYDAKEGYTEINGLFYESMEATESKMFADLYRGDSFTFYLKLFNKPSKALYGDTIATVTIRIAEGIGE